MKLFSSSNKNKLIKRKKYHNWIDAFGRGYFPTIKEEYTCYIDKSLISEDNPKGERIEGVYKSWYTNGTIETEKNYKNGVLDGISKEYNTGNPYARKEISEMFSLGEESQYKNGELVYKKKYLSVNYLKLHLQPELNLSSASSNFFTSRSNHYPYLEINSFFENINREIAELNNNFKEKIELLPWEKLLLLEKKLWTNEKSNFFTLSISN